MPKKIRTLKLGTQCKDKATGLTGTLTHWIINEEGMVVYLFQPRHLDLDGQPVKKICLEATRLKVKDDDFENVWIPFEILGTPVTDMASGFAGTAVEFVRHINGCFHVMIQPKGLSKKTNEPIKSAEFDLRQCTGPMIVKLSEEELVESRAATPSPTGDKFERPLPTSVQVIRRDPR